MMAKFDVLVVGGGHAGCEAAAAAARMGACVALVTMRRDQIGAMSCNPAIGGLGKGHLVREVDAFDGVIARAADAAAIHYRMLNSSKGAAVQGPRVQADRALFRTAVQAQLDAEPNITVVEGEAAQLLFGEPDSICGLRLGDGRELHAAAVVPATGTFLNGKLHFGMTACAGGRVGEEPSIGMAQQLRAIGLPIARLKTGTPPRLDGRTIDWTAVEMQPSDEDRWTFSSVTERRVNPEIACGITRTNTDTHRIIRDSLDRSPLFAGVIEGQGPRYCPSIEDKVVRFGDREGHQVFLEPEGLRDHLVYPNGISTSLPVDVQEKLVRSIAGLEQVEIVQPGYAVEYDHIDPCALDPTLSTRAVRGLYCAGQINGTTGYEEAAAQGLVAGLNAAAYASGGSEIIFDRADSYIGVMVDDLTLQGVTEPYRMLTARAEYRLRLRADNAGTRLSSWADKLGALGNVRHRLHVSRETARANALELLSRQISAQGVAAQGCDVGGNGAKRTLFEWLSFQDFSREALLKIEPRLERVDPSVLDELINDGRYAPYVGRQLREIDRMRADEAVCIPAALNYRAIGGLSNEMVERLEAARPLTLGAAGRVRGITPAALGAILVHCKRKAA
ncbi:MAG: tRNA uridine-5-carboxymethylaminomethyl(34) synthesis enzyme MnmG [Sphingomonadaceae bacterium]